MPSLTLVELAAGAASPVMRAVAQAPDGSVFVGVEQASVGLPVLYVVSGGALAPVTLPDSGDLIIVSDFAVGPTALYALAQVRVYVYQEVDSSWGWSVFAQVPEAGTTLAWHEGSLYLGAESGLYQYQRWQWILVQEWVGAPSRLRELGKPEFRGLVSRRRLRSGQQRFYYGRLASTFAAEPGPHRPRPARGDGGNVASE